MSDTSSPARIDSRATFRGSYLYINQRRIRSYDEVGHSYTLNGGLLCCDRCGKSGGVRKRTCTARIVTTSHKMADNQRHSLPYCSPPALCSECYRDIGGNKALHARCHEAVAIQQKEYDEEQQRLDSGDSQISARWGDWHKLVPAGKCGCVFADGSGRETWLLTEGDDEKAKWLSDVITVEPWEPHA